MSVRRKPKEAQKPARTNPPSVAISSRDQKILWSRSAGRCSIGDCRRPLTFDAADGSSKTLGEMCHIVGEKESSPRGKSCLTDKERNSYSNLILLCGYHHTMIDGDEARYPIEVLHAIKDNHEQWVSETLGSEQPDPDELVYSYLIDSITVLLQLERWSWFVDDAVRGLVPVDVADAQGTLNRIRMGAIWPQKKPALKRAIVGVLEAFDEFVDHYMTNADLHPNDKFYGPDRSHRRFAYPPDQQRECERREAVWSQICFWLICSLALKLNRFAGAVRRFSNPLYFRMHGKFLIGDSMGCWFGGRDTLYDPSLSNVKRGLAKCKYTLKTV